jgi:hypothetical protein
MPASDALSAPGALRGSTKCGSASELQRGSSLAPSFLLLVSRPPNSTGWLRDQPRPWRERERLRQELAGLQ